MQIAEILSPKSVLCGHALPSKKALLEELSRLLSSTNAGLKQMDVFTCLTQRERLGGTDLGQGVAIPHGRLSKNDKTIAAFIRLRQGVDYDAKDGRLVDLIFALLVPEHADEEHLRILAHLAQIFSYGEILDRLRLESNPGRVYEILTSAPACQKTGA